MVHQTVSPGERVGSGDETTSNQRAASRERNIRLEISTDTHRHVGGSELFPREIEAKLHLRMRDGLA